MSPEPRVLRFTREYTSTEIPSTVASLEEQDYPIPEYLTCSSLNRKRDYAAISAQPPLDLLPRGLIPHPRTWYPPTMHYGWRLDDEHTARAVAYYKEHGKVEERHGEVEEEHEEAKDENLDMNVDIWQAGFRLMIERELGLRFKGYTLQTASGVMVPSKGPSNDVLSLYNNYCLALAAPKFPDDTVERIQQVLGFKQDPKWFLDMIEIYWI
ncbi:hypothetical protein A0H81_13393 [Grifola frondosa]|uniref:Uncharacterized protein n=1 Tax=Grifola frondosa TaxID=5627 RepID=A0A1C7LPC9_GRIFR|nr:hypothetical protein A0H81_13393 [Grifola frondosa]